LVTGRKLLLADDSATIQKVIDLTFSDEGLEVITVSDGRQAIEKLDEVLPDIVLADIFMPGMSGYEVCEYIKRTERFSHIPVMLLVGSFEPFDEAEARRVGADDYLTKPFQSIRTLIGKVSGLLSGGGSNEDATTRKLVPPPEAEKENRPETGFLERSTADTAPLPQHEREQKEVAGGHAAREVSYNDLSMDDELIETMPGSGYAGGASASTDAQDPRMTAQYSAADFEEAGISPTNQHAPAPAPPEEEIFDGYATVPAAQPAAQPAPAATAASRPVSSQPVMASARASSIASADDALLDLGDLDAPHSMIEADDFILDLRDETDEQPSAAASFNEAPAYTFETPSFETAEEMDAAARTDYEAETAQAQGDYAAAQAFTDEQAGAFAPAEEAGASFEEATSVGETPRVSQYQQPAAEDTTTEEFYLNAQAAPTERLPDDFQMQGTASAPATEAESGTPAAAEPAASAPAGQITLEQLSPEAIDAIARRAVELLSERVVEQIAWEVVPDLAERLVKRRLEEEKSQT
jgi:CheY-like chemotaxis protein